MVQTAFLLCTHELSSSLTVQPNCLKDPVLYGTVSGDMHLKDLLGSFTGVEYCISVPDFYLVLHGPSIIHRSQNQAGPGCRPEGNRARKSRTTLQNKVRLKVLPEQLTLFVNTSVTLKKCIIQ